MAHFNDLPPEEPARERGPYRRQNAPARTLLPVPLGRRLLRFVRGGQVRTAEAGADLPNLRPEGWSSGRLLAWLRARSGEGKEKRSWLRKLLYHLLTWIRRDLDADHH